MTISVWRYSHLALAVSSFLFIALAAITGCILAFQPVSQKVQPYSTQGFNRLTLAQTLPVLKKSFTEVIDIKVDDNEFVIVSGIDGDGNDTTAYVDAGTGKIQGAPQKESEFFQWVTTLHRSLFLHEAGRIFMGVIAFLLFMIAVSGTVLVLQRQKGIRRFFNKIVKESFSQYYHVVLGRLMLIPIIIIAGTGTWLTLDKFIGGEEEVKIKHTIDFDNLKTEPQKTLADFAIFKNTKLADVKSIEFPFSEDVEDYFTLKLTDREIVVNQITGEVLSEVAYPAKQLYTNLSLNLHTGRTNMVWAIILAIASANILFFIYSGFVITLKRRKNRIKNKFKADESRFVILVGSENGSTFRFADAIHQQLLKNGEKSFMAELNSYNVFDKAEHIIVFAATYGLGDAPTNASKFINLLKKYPQPNAVKFSVLGFGSHSYPDFCRFGFEVNNALSAQEWATPLMEIHTVNDKSPDDFKQWATLWSQMAEVPLDVSANVLSRDDRRMQTFTVVDKTLIAHPEETFMIRLKPKRVRFTSGDLLAIYPANDHRERLYSIGKVGKNVQLSVRMHEHGLGSGFLNALEAGQTFKAKIVSNAHFHLPKKSPVIIMVSNGTGIAPFLGMIDENTRKTDCHLYCGFPRKTSFDLYKDNLTQNIRDKKLTKLNVAYSREGEKQYVKHLLENDADLIAAALKQGGTIMLCGSLSMQKDVIVLLETICHEKNGKEVSYYQGRGQVLMDCY